jgi:hypothetical protein
VWVNYPTDLHPGPRPRRDKVPHTSGLQTLAAGPWRPGNLGSSPRPWGAESLYSSSEATSSEVDAVVIRLSSLTERHLDRGTGETRNVARG